MTATMKMISVFALLLLGAVFAEQQQQQQETTTDDANWVFFTEDEEEMLVEMDYAMSMMMVSNSIPSAAPSVHHPLPSPFNFGSRPPVAYYMPSNPPTPRPTPPSRSPPTRLAPTTTSDFEHSASSSVPSTLLSIAPSSKTSHPTASPSLRPTAVPTLLPSSSPSSFPTSEDTQHLITIEVFATITVNVSLVDIPLRQDLFDAFLLVLGNSITSSVEQPANTTLLAAANVALTPTIQTSTRRRRRRRLQFGSTTDIDFRLDVYRDCFHSIIAGCETDAMAELAIVEQDLEAAATNQDLTNLIQSIAQSVGSTALVNAAVVRYKHITSRVNIRKVEEEGGEELEVDTSSSARSLSMFLESFGVFAMLYVGWLAA